MQILFWLHEAGLPMTGANVARAMQLSAPTVHEMVGRLERDGYITRNSSRTISFTSTGAEHAEGIVRRHRLIERFLTDVLGVPWDEVHEEAERLEHAMSPVLEERMLAAIGDATTCPHGHPIVAGARLAGVPLADVEVGAEVRILRFENEAEDLLRYLKASGIEPGLEGRLVEPRRRAGDRRDRRRSAMRPHALCRRDGLGHGRPFTAAAYGSTRAVGARPALRPLTRSIAGAGRSAIPSIADRLRPRRSRAEHATRGGRASILVSLGYRACQELESDRYASASSFTPSSICSGVTPE